MDVSAKFQFQFVYSQPIRIEATKRQVFSDRSWPRAELVLRAARRHGGHVWQEGEEGGGLGP